MVWTLVSAHDSESLDRCLQTALSALYPPFQDTSPTVLCQVLSVVERCYRGDGLRYLLHFLLPAKHFLQSLQQDACLPYCGLLFRHEGWPLCLHEKIVVQLCHLDQHLLLPGDFYLLVSPSSSSSSSTSSSASSSRRGSSRSGHPTPRLLLCSVSKTSRHVEEQEIPELALSSMFTMAWLDSVNRDREERGLSKMERLLLSAHGDVFRVPWEDLVYPQFVSRPRGSLKDLSAKEASFSSSSEQDATQEKTLLHSLEDKPELACTVDQSMPSSDDSDSEGEYVELTELPRFSPQKGSLTQLISQQHKARTSTQIPDKNIAQKVPTQFQNTPKDASTKSKDVQSLHTKSKRKKSKSFNEEGSSVVANGPVVLTPVEQSTGETSDIEKGLLQGSKLTKNSKQVDKKVVDPVVAEDGLVNVDLIDERKDGEVVGKSVEEEKGVEMIGGNAQKDREVALVERIETQEKSDRKEQESGEFEDLKFNKMQCTDLGKELEIESMYETQSEQSELTEKMHLQDSDVKEESAYLETSDIQHFSKDDSENEKLNSKDTVPSENVELSLDAYIDNQFLSHTELLQTRIIYLEATDSGNIFDSQGEECVYKNDEFGEKEWQCPETNKTQDQLDEDQNLLLVETQSSQVDVAESESAFGNPDSELQIENVQQFHTQDGHLEDVAFGLDKSEKMGSTIEIGDNDEDEMEDTITNDCKEIEPCNLQDILCESICEVVEEERTFQETKTLESEMSNEQDVDDLEIMQILSEIVDKVANMDQSKKDGLVEKQGSDSSVMLLEEQIDILETEFKLLQSKIHQINHADFEDNQEISMASDETAVQETFSEIFEQKKDEEVLDCEENILQVEIVPVQDDQVSSPIETRCREGKLDVEIPQSKDSKLQDRNNNESVENLDHALKIDENVQLSDETLIISSEEIPQTIENVSEQSDVLNSKVLSVDTTLCLNSEVATVENVIVNAETEHLSSNLDKTITPTEKLFTKSPLPIPETVEEEEIDNANLEIQEAVMDAKNDCLNCLTSNIENETNENANTEHLLSNSERILDKNDNIQKENCESPQINNIEKLKEATPVTSLLENGPKNEDLKKVETLDVKCTNSECFPSLNGQVEMSKAPCNGPKVKTGDAKDIFESRKGLKQLNKVPTEGPLAAHPSAALTNGSDSRPPEPPCFPGLPSPPLQLSKSPQSRFNQVLLTSGVLCLPGSRDRAGRAVVTVNSRGPVWSSPDCDSAELLQVLLYYLSTLRKEVQALGLNVLVDVRRAPPVPALYTALRSLEEGSPGSVHSVLLLINKDSPIRLDKPPYLQVEMLYSMKSLQKHVDLRQLPVEFGGSFNFSQSSWLCYRARVEHLTNQCNNAIGLLHQTIHILESTPPDDSQDAEQLLSKYSAVMCSILQDSRLVQLQQEGGASLSRLRRDESSLCATDDYRAAVDEVSALYDQVDELLHRLVTLSNSRNQEIHFIKEFTGLESGFSEVQQWLEKEGETRLKSLSEPEDSLELLLKHQKDFKDFCPTAYDWCRRGQDLLKRLEHWDNISSSALHSYEVKVHSFWARLQDFSQRVTSTGHSIDQAVSLYSFLDQAYGWALAGMRHLAGVTMEDCTLPEKCPVVISCLEEYNRLHPPLPDSRFQEMRALAGELRGERGLRQWSFAWSKCQETKKMFDRKMEAALRTRDSNQRRRSDSEQSRSSSSFYRKSLSGFWGMKDASQISTNENDDAVSTCSSSTPSPPRHSTSSPITSTPQHTPLLQRLFRSPSHVDDTKDSVEIPPSPAPSLQRLDSSGSANSSANSSFRSPSICSSSSFAPFSRRQQLRKTQSFDCPPTPDATRYGATPRTLSEPGRRGNTGVFIKGLEVSSTEAADRTLCPRTGAQGWATHASRSPSTQSINSVSSTAESRPRGSKLRHIVEEMVTTEREYVRSLQYIIHHYFPEMERPDVPQDLRGKRATVFGNLEKLLDFHSQFFLKELEACWRHPLRVPHCFLRHQEQFGLYALYSKNKPKSDSLLSHHGNSFFRRKQVELGDKMDLSSYLLKPIQRMSKYALLLSDLIKEVGVSQSQEAELATLHAATNMVKFQLRHGNDLLAMDAIRDCDVNLKEQGQLIRQDEFTVWSGRRKCQRHVFLFEDLVLFSKPKRMEGGLDVFIYKHSFKTADIGLTESTGDDGLKFEIWFRRRTSKNQTFVLQALSSEVKLHWTNDIARLLWNQANRNKEMRLKEMVSMGVGSKPFLDIQPSDAAISDRAVHYIMKSRGARTRASIAVSVFDHNNPFKRSVTSDSSAVPGPSSCSLLGPLNLHMFSQTLPPAGASEGSFINSCIEEDEQEHETSSQPSMTTESSGSSSRCLSGSTGSDSGCVSSHLQEALQEEQNPSQTSSSSSSSSHPPPTNKQLLSSPYISANPGPVIGPATVV